MQIPLAIVFNPLTPNISLVIIFPLEGNSGCPGIF